MADEYQKLLLSEIISDIKNYNGGGDPLRPWIHGIRRMKESLPPPLLKEKLPRFLQKCAQEFESDRRYRNDSRYVRVWVELMDYVDDAKVILKRMEKNSIGFKRAMFYLAYALYYEKHKKFGEAENMYHAGVQNLAEPVSELQKSYEQFLHRMALFKKRKAKAAISKNGCSLKGIEDNVVDDKVQTAAAKEVFQRPNYSEGIGHHGNITDMIDSNILFGHPKAVNKSFTEFNKSRHKVRRSVVVNKSSENGGHSDDRGKQIPLCADDTVVVKFVESAIVGKSEAEDACHHGLVDPTINMKEAMNDISSMFREPLEPVIMVKRRSSQSKPETFQPTDGFKVFVDEDVNDGHNYCSHYSQNDQCEVHMQRVEVEKPFNGVFKILADEEIVDKQMEVSKSLMNASISSKPDNPQCNSHGNPEMHNSRLNDEAIVRRFVGSTVLGEPKLENACHHGLLDPTINLKEAMDDINSMFGEPLDFFKVNKPKKQGYISTDKKPACNGFSIFTDDELDDQRGNASVSIPCNIGETGDQFEPTIFTKEALTDINEMFGKPLDL